MNSCNIDAFYAKLAGFPMNYALFPENEETRKGFSTKKASVEQYKRNQLKRRYFHKLLLNFEKIFLTKNFC